MINEPTRITDKSSTLIDLCITNSPVNVVNSGVLHLSMSDHLLVYMVRNAQYKRNGSRIVKVRSLKNFSRENFLRDLELKQWGSVHCFKDPNEMWATWKSMLMDTIDKHAPCRSRRIGKKRSSWITNDLKRQMFKRDYLKKKLSLQRILKLGTNIDSLVITLITKSKKPRHHILPQTLIYTKEI